MPSLRGRMIRWLLRRMTAKGTTFRKPIARQREEMEQRMARLKVPRDVCIHSVDCSGVPGEWVIPEATSRSRTVMYFHGGGYYNGSLATHRSFVARLASVVQGKVLHFGYRLAPEHPFPAAVEDGLSVYRWLLAQGIDPQSLVIAGESAGGNLVATTLLEARSHNLPLPAAAVCISPHLDFTFSGPSIAENAASELLYTLEELEWMRGIYLGERWNREEFLREGRISPLWADLTGLPPLLLLADGTEMLRDDAVRMAEKIRTAGGKAELRIWPGLFHAFPLVSMIPEAGLALREIADFMDRHG
ncbi:MAG: alpha/beta hydrolase [Magnetococcales bacterium]|nr:alpha/beta hydrolase [Magnetococcales bacterium]